MFSLADQKIKLIILAVLGIPILIIVSRFLPTANSLEKLAENNLKKAFEESSIPYKDVSVKVVKNDGTRALVKEIFTVQHKCVVAFDKEYHSKIGRTVGTWISSFPFNEEYRPYGVTPLSEDDYELLGQMGLIDTTFDLQKEDEAKIKWKHCYVFREYVKSGNKWSTDIIGPITLDAWGFILPPQEQEKLGYKITDEMRKKASENLKSSTNDAVSRGMTDNSSRDEDTAIRNTTAEFYNASVRYYGLKNEFPWKFDLNGVVLSDSSMILSPDGYISLIIDAGELKKDFIEKAGSEKLNRIFVTSKANSQIAICFLPITKEFKRDVNSRFDKFGAPKSDCSTGDKSGEECYWCVK